MRVCDTLMVCDAINVYPELTVTGPLPHARNHFVITTGFVATKVAVTTRSVTASICFANLKPKGRTHTQSVATSIS